ncbi:hypothetical protein Calow_0349 [Caldicellulosiruptor owensensis OL]|uniref:Uncharacterized protein n=1 Tax=Caldicellulosiruptor owensensis (strain ATCC 700167 / DSM 13100 / OL) TaxID=632518 RepID=E4Q3H8_CALOW|nr:hypothetical protein [Caldicellulosiruptor owensensis]ADQ03938.1 hypothetical protein Calow_0349 [Caldicellulosiruptor owensensis OL]
MKARKRIIVLISIMILILKSTLVLSNDKNEKIEKGYYDYSGKKGSKDIIMSIYINNSKITGLYAFKGVKEHIKVEGKLKNGKITLNEFNKKGKIAGTFYGNLKTADTVEGTWSNGKIKLPFKLKLVDVIYTDYGKRYNLVGFPDEEVVKFATNIQKYLIKNDKKALAKLIVYPIDVKIDGKKKSIKNEKEFINNFDKIFNGNLKKAIINADPLFMFVNQYGAMLGENGYNIWFTGVQKKDKKYYLLIYTINN